MKKIIFFPIIMIIIFEFFLLLRNSKFNTTIPDVIEIPKEVQEGIANVVPDKQFYVPILLYHYVEIVKDPGDTIRKSLDIFPSTFEAEIKTLKEAGYTFITMKDLADVLDNKITLPKKPVILTFDDGYRDFYTDVFPILKKYQVKAVAYIVTNFIDRPDNLTTRMLKEIVKSNLVEIGAHTENHTWLAGNNLKRVESEIFGSKKYLEKLLGMEIGTFAYPYGAFDNQSIAVVKKAGFKTAVSTVNGNLVMDTNRFYFYRTRPGGRVGKSLLELIEKKTFPKQQ